MRNRRIVLFSGMGGDSRLITPLNSEGIEIFSPDHIEPKANESLPHYAARVAKVHSIVHADVVGGASFGGMLAAEIAHQIPTAGLILLGSCVRPSRLSRSYKWIHRVSKFIPDSFLAFRTWSPLMKWRFGPIKDEHEKVLVDMAARCSAAQIRHFGRMIIEWEGLAEIKCPVLSIHGDRDRIIPLISAEPGVVLKKAGHAFTLTHVAETVREIRQFVATLA